MSRIRTKCNGKSNQFTCAACCVERRRDFRSAGVAPAASSEIRRAGEPLPDPLGEIAASSLKRIEFDPSSSAMEDKTRSLESSFKVIF